MNARRTYRSVLGLLGAALVATFATGCETLRGLRADLRSASPVNKAPTDPLQNAGGPVGNPDPGVPQPQPGVNGGMVVGASGTLPQDQAPMMTQPLPPIPTAPPYQLPSPQQLPPGFAIPPSKYPRTAPGYGTQFADPHLRGNPTVTGRMWELGPAEVPTERVAELSRQLEFAMAQNRDLIARIKDMEARGSGREEALAEAMREIEAVNADAAKTRIALQARITALQDRIKQIEAEDIELLELVIKALRKLIPPEGK